MKRRTREPDPCSRAFGKEKETTFLSLGLALFSGSKAHPVPLKTYICSLHTLEVAQKGLSRDLITMQPTLLVLMVKPKGLLTQQAAAPLFAATTR